MSKYKKIAIYLSCVGIICVLFGTTYSFFNYTRSGSSNTLETGRISFNSSQGSAINLTDVFPIDVTNGIPNNANVGSVIINVTGDTNYDNGIEYLVTAENVNNTVGTGINARVIPISVDVSVTSNTNNSPSTTLGDHDEDYFINRETTESSIYKILSGNTIQGTDKLVVGYIKSGATGVDGNIVIRAYIDENNVAITDTYPLETTNSWTNGRIVLTSSEWNDLQTNGISFQVKVVSNDGIWVDEPILCKRVTDSSLLHTEICRNEDTTAYCQADGYQLNSVITYGNAKTSGELETGDAFDCNVDGTGFNQRFYYVSDYYDLDTQSYDENTAVLIYYSSVINGVAAYGDVEYSSEADIVSKGYQCGAARGCNWYGPLTILKNLPTNSQWSMMRLKKTGRKLLACQSGTCSGTLVEQTSGGHFDNPFNYAGKAARLLTPREISRGCRTVNGDVSITDDGSLAACNFILEGTKYADSSKASGIWLENPRSTSSTLAWAVYSNSRRVSANYVNALGAMIHPAIDVPYSMLKY